MRLVIILLIINLLLSSCIAENETETFSPIGEDKNELGLTDSFVQTEIEKNEIFTYKDSSISKNYKFQHNFEEWNFEEIDLSTYENIKRIGDSLIFNFANSTFMLINEEYDEELENYEASDFKMV